MSQTVAAQGPSAPVLICAICDQPILPGEDSDTFRGDCHHENPDLCAERAVNAERVACAEIARQAVALYRAAKEKLPAHHWQGRAALESMATAAEVVALSIESRGKVR